MRHSLWFAAFIVLVGLATATLAAQNGTKEPNAADSEEMRSRTELATFAGGCFWCMEAPFEKVNGVLDVVSGFGGGTKPNPSYQDVAAGGTKYVETIQITYDPAQVRYPQLLEIFWRQIDPTDAGGQFVDRGYQYSTAIFYHNKAQKTQAEQSKNRLEVSGRFNKPIATRIAPYSTFHAAEAYHQDYYKTHPFRYKTYRFYSGRDRFLKKVWSKSMKEDLKSRLTPLQYKVTQEDGTERPFANEYWDNAREGIYVDIVSGEPLFSSKDKFKSGTGWPSFTKPLEPENIIEKKDRKLLTLRTEVRSKSVDSHLGHVFNDGPAPTRLRYCINSAALRFVAKEELKEYGLENYLRLFD